MQFTNVAGVTELLIINPNTSAEVSGTIDQLARDEFGTAVVTRTVTATFGARYIGSRVGVAIAGHATLEAYSSALAAGAKPHAVVLACFGDPGLEALREISPVPVFAFAECGLTAAAAEPGHFAIATIGEAWRDMLTELVERRGLTERFAGVITLGEESRVGTVAARHIQIGVARTGANRVIVGGTGLIPAMPDIVRALPSMVLDPHRLTLRVAAAAAGHVLAPVRQNSDFVGLAPALQRLLA